jgi:hypothetical protein
VSKEPDIMDMEDVHRELMEGIDMVIHTGDPLKILPKLNDLRKRLEAHMKKLSGGK